LGEADKSPAQAGGGPTSEDQTDTRERLLAAALKHFAERGFHGASIAGIAGDLGLTKQALLYYFKRKQDLYGEVVRVIGEGIVSALRSRVDPAAPPAQQIETMVLVLYENAQANPYNSRFLMHELLENQRREAQPDQWFIKNFLDLCVGTLDRIDGLAERPFAQKFAVVYQMISAIQYFTASGPVLKRFYGDEEYERISAAYPAELRAQLQRLIECPEGC
jgi:AcrR family transcriptional regulator